MSLINLKNIKKSYELGGVNFEVLRGIDLDIENGEFLSIMGVSGSGKSTLLNIIGMLDIPSTGEYIFDGKDVSKLDDDSQSLIRRKSIGFIFQNYNLIKKTSAINQVMLPLMYQGVAYKERYTRAFEALKKVGLEEHIDKLPSEMSGGQQQRVSIARAIVTNPSLILGDEPTGALDSITGKEVMEIIKKLNEEGRTIVIITHSPEVNAYAKRFVTIKDGIIIK